MVPGDRIEKQRGPVDCGDPNRNESMGTNSYVLEYCGELTNGTGLVQIASLTFLALDDFDYALRITGTAGLIGTPYLLGVAAVSPVPLAVSWSSDSLGPPFRL